MNSGALTFSQSPDLAEKQMLLNELDRLLQSKFKNIGAVKKKLNICIEERKWTLKQRLEVCGRIQNHVVRFGELNPCPTV